MVILENNFNANNIKPKTTTRDTTLESVNIAGKDINMDVENLTLTSLQNTQDSSSQSVEMTIGTSAVGAKLSSSKENKEWKEEQSSIIGENVTINVNNKTILNGSIIASQDKDDNNNLNLTTNQLEVNNLTDTHKAKTQGLGINGNAEKSKFTEQQIIDIQKGKSSIDGYTWHHNADSNNMQLVPEKVHDATRHIGEAKMKDGN